MAGGAVGHNFFKGYHPSTLSAKFGLILFSGFIEDLNVISFIKIFLICIPRTTDG